jgi:3-hydroxyisobutyrate dehydrogenase-like beta-hydroxyacid dehydrogenase
MTDITMIGLGAMGSALAAAFVGAGHRVTVWNRSPEKMQPLLAKGASGAESLAAAVEASPLLVVCIDNYDATRSLFDANGILSGLAGKTLVQLSTDTPEEVRACADWLAASGVAYIDGAIMPYPDGIGQTDARLLFAGPEAAYAAALPYLRCLGGDLQYLGEKVAAAAVLDMALLTYELCGYLAALHGAGLCRAEGVSVDRLAALYPGDSSSRRLAAVIHAGDFGNPGATLTVWEAAVQRIQDQARDAGINSEVPDLISRFFKRAIDAGYGEEDVGAVIKVL